MSVELAVALIANVVALATAGGTIWSSRRNAENSNANAKDIEILKGKNAKDIETLKYDNDQLKAAAQRQRDISEFSEPLARSAYDPQSRLYNILKLSFINVFLVKGTERTKLYAANNTVFLVGQYLCWKELVRRGIQFIDLGESEKTRNLLCLQDAIDSIWGTDKITSPAFRVFAGEQRAIGEALIQAGARGPECMGYGAFLKTFNQGVNPLIDVLRADVMSLESGLNHATERLTKLQNPLIDLLDMLDPPPYLRFPADSRSKV
ncbi:MAG TPA: hypothetical protein VNZ53_47830 [Steroidobacteraceae bacterium]|jgi:hypothetical protein|nr:hypothetical protein [Steroidobacteraceae bacterium]HWZ66336.1 hypothetical protein [Stellaceae bacterium]